MLFRTLLVDLFALTKALSEIAQVILAPMKIFKAYSTLLLERRVFEFVR